MLNQELKNQIVSRVLPGVRTPGQYVGGELNSVVKDHATVRGKVCLAFPDTYALGMSHHGLQVLYSLLNAGDWACERVFTPLPDFEAGLREHGLPLTSLETFTPLRDFDVLGFSLQYEICDTNVLTMLDLGGIALHADDRGPEGTLVIAGGPGGQNPELLAPFIDLFVIGDGEPSLPVVCELWTGMKSSGLSREEKLARIAAECPWAYVPRFYEPIYGEDGTIVEIRRTRDDVPASVRPCVIQDLEGTPLPTKPIVPFVETAHDRIAIEIMRGCPWQCRFCQSTVIKRPLRYRTVETIVQSALESYESTGYDEISLLSLSTSDYPHFEELVTRMSEVFTPLGVKISLPSLRITETLKKIPALLQEGRRSGLTLAPEVARDDMREQIRKPINNTDLYDGCAEAFRRGWRKVKLYFMCGLPGERKADLDGIVEMAETIARIGKEVTGRYADVTAAVSNFVPKPHTPYQWNGMKPREYFHWAHKYLRSRVRVRSVSVKVHDIERSLLEGILTRGDRRVAAAVEEAWRRGARLDAWTEYFDANLWWKTFEDMGIDVPFYSQRERPVDEVLPWDHIHIKYGRDYLAKEQNRSVVQLEAMAGAV
ncbi:Radical SAM superfamily protein [Aquisphaera giovannonii]|uniref:Radical SAM superfamily protein n=1 Tax=Aquisphaera giovannonii TaxID=406548 RepID=A0A5B9W863_9BACT|nr:TIGR03960 family B12-binding radical SAM protein [Aquisphaera giovannonii]QEH36788.1 Radical SAM superfamily protein [Aquisphaera giovannonii]